MLHILPTNRPYETILYGTSIASDRLAKEDEVRAIGAVIINRPRDLKYVIHSVSICNSTSRVMNNRSLRVQYLARHVDEHEPNSQSQ
jgi:hypothetical protein